MREMTTLITKFETVNGERIEIRAWDDGDVSIMGNAGLFTLEEIKFIIASLQRHVNVYESKE